MRWFWRWIEKKIRDEELVKEPMPLGMQYATAMVKGYDKGPKVINFSITICEGGYLLQTSTYNQQTGGTESRMLVIDESKDYGEIISDFCKMELLR